MRPQPVVVQRPQKAEAYTLQTICVPGRMATATFASEDFGVLVAHDAACQGAEHDRHASRVNAAAGCHCPPHQRRARWRLGVDRDNWGILPGMNKGKLLEGRRDVLRRRSRSEREGRPGLGNARPVAILGIDPAESPASLLTRAAKCTDINEVSCRSCQNSGNYA
jgi:hypothetical protein